MCVSKSIGLPFAPAPGRLFPLPLPLKMADGAVVLFYGLLNTQNSSPVLDIDAAGDRVWFSSGFGVWLPKGVSGLFSSTLRLPTHSESQ